MKTNQSTTEITMNHNDLFAAPRNLQNELAAANNDIYHILLAQKITQRLLTTQHTDPNARYLAPWLYSWRCANNRVALENWVIKQIVPRLKAEPQISFHQLMQELDNTLGQSLYEYWKDWA